MDTNNAICQAAHADYYFTASIRSLDFGLTGLPVVRQGEEMARPSSHERAD